MRIYLIDQRSDAWRQLRAGKVTGSVAKDMLATIKAGEAAARRDLRFKLVAERLSGQSQDDGYINAAMQWGIDREAEAVQAYEAKTGAFVERVGFCEHDDLPTGTSPDGFVSSDGIVSIKCPKTATHIKYLRDGIEPAEHAAQNTHELWLTGRAWLDFVSYDPRLPEPLRLFVLRVTRSASDLRSYEARLKAFLDEVDRECEAISTVADLPGQLAAAVETR